MIHLEYNGASLMFFKVFDAEGRQLECCPEKGGRGIVMVWTRPANRFPNSSSGGGGGARGSSDSAELRTTPETSDDSYEPLSSHRARSRVVSSGRRHH